MSGLPTCTIDGFGPVLVLRPTLPAEVGDLVRRAAAEGAALYPLSGQTHLHIGLPPTRPGYGVDLRALNAVIDYPARDLTITVQAGITLSQLRRLLAAENQRLPVDVPQADRATLGGALAVNASGPRRYGSGTLRDYVIGITTINDEGQETKAGGRVVKNVAGYDLCKLHVGALGTLGIISQVTLKLRPLPETHALVTLGCEATGLDGLLDQLHRSRIRPGCLELVNADTARVLMREAGVNLPASPWVVVVGFEDSAASVNWQVQQLLKDVAESGVHGLEARAGAAGDRLWQALVELAAPPGAALSFKANLLPGAVASFCRAASEWDGVQLHAHAGSGIVHGHLLAVASLESVRVRLDTLAEAAAAQGNLVLPRCPLEWKQHLPVWGRPRGDLRLMREVKQQLDPRELFNPGRFV